MLMKNGNGFYERLMIEQKLYRWAFMCVMANYKRKMRTTCTLDDGLVCASHMLRQ
jgi:hypothetical protein